VPPTPARVLFVGPDGRKHSPTDLAATTLAYGQVWKRGTRTAYGVTGDWLPAMAIGACLGTALDRLWRRRRPRRHARPRQMTIHKQMPTCYLVITTTPSTESNP